ncbi:hypothetical protein M885DRAFT_556897 [Pelagophyceae sp. CCMP2097]|nr:hypothetical protein M885DRAFT_556897 [Pelagophyceae sp. CCMP2097]
MEAQHLVMVCILVWIVLLEKVLPLSNFAARKLCHAGCGLGMLLLDSETIEARIFVAILAASSIAMVWGVTPLPPFRFAQMGDVGVTVYLLLVSAWFAIQQPPLLLAPLFFADPAGAVIGKWASRTFPGRNLRWYNEKTVCGSAAVFAVTALSISFPCSNAERLVIAAAAAAAEAVGGAYDNLAIAAAVAAGAAWTKR